MKLKKHLGMLAGAVALFAITSSARAEIGAELSFWGMGVLTSGGRDGGTSSCSAGSNEFCGDVFGYGGAASVYVPIGWGLSFSADILHEYHGETHENSSDRNDAARYSALGFHLTRDANPNIPWGLFMFTAAGTANAEDDNWGPMFGIGAEIMLSGFKIQTGRIGLFENNNVSDNMDHMYFLGVAREFSVWNGDLSVGAMYGQGDFNADSEDDQGNWFNVSLMYEAPLKGTKINWFAGYQGDYLIVDQEFSSTDEAFFHTLKAGITIPLGSGKGPFQTPNFRAPLVNADAMNGS